MGRLAVYVFWEKDGIVRDYVTTYLKGLMAVASKIYVVVNGDICPEGQMRIEKETGAIVLQRDNEGVDFWAYKTALEEEGKEISAYEEVVLCNCSCYGPVYPFTEMFEEMHTRYVDFWGITEWPLNAGGYQGTWVLSYFMVFRPHIFLSPEWSYYWKNLSPVYSREECIEKHESKFTSYFAKKGFTYDVYCHNTLDYIDPTIEAPDELVIVQRCPIIKRKVFCTEYSRFLSYHRGLTSKRVFDYVGSNGLYDTDEILDDLLATQHGAYLRDCLQLDYVLSYTGTEESLSHRPQIAICFHMENESLLDENFRYLQVAPVYAEIYITISKALKALVEEKITAYHLDQCTLVETDTAGGSVAALLALADHLSKFEYVCAVHDGQIQDSPAGIFRGEIRRFALDGVLASRAYVENLLSLFEREPRLGILSPFNALHGSYCARYGQEWGLNYEITNDFLKKADIDVPISPDVPPVAPTDAMFWFRPASLQKLLNIHLSNELFQAGNPDGTLYHAVLRALPYFAQDAGFLSGQVISSAGAENHILNLTYLYRQANLALSGKTDAVYIPVQMEIGVKGAMKAYLKKHTSPKLWSFLKRIYNFFN